MAVSDEWIDQFLLDEARAARVATMHANLNLRALAWFIVATVFAVGSVVATSGTPGALDCFGFASAFAAVGLSAWANRKFVVFRYTTTLTDSMMQERDREIIDYVTLVERDVREMTVPLNKTRKVLSYSLAFACASLALWATSAMMSL